MQIIKKLPIQIILFLFFSGCLASFINTGNTLAFGLQSRCIEALVGNRTIFLDNPTDKMEFFTSSYTWDVFSYKDHVYINKAPGQFFLGAIPYLFLKLFGITYKSNFNLSCGVITFFTSILMTSLIMVLLFNISFNILKNRMKSFFVAFFAGFGTLLLPYSGVLQHDMCATFFLFLGFYFLFYRYHISNKHSLCMVLLSGFFTGFSFFNSYNVITIISIICLYVLCKRNINEIVLFFLSLLVGFSVTFIFNFIVFDSPLNFAIVLYSNFFHQSHEFSLSEYLPSILKRIDLYLISPITAIEFYSPIYIISYFGILLLPKKYFVEKTILLLAFPLQFFQPCLFGVAGYGWCQYGPRYLLESIPFTMVGLIGYFAWSKRLPVDKQNLLNSFILFFGIVSVVICAVGTIGVVYCNFYEYGFSSYLKRIVANKDLPIYYFAPFAIVATWFSTLLLFVKYKRYTIKTVFNWGFYIIRTITFLFLVIFYIWFLSAKTWNLFQPTYLGTIFDSLGDGILKGTYEVDRFALAWEAFIINGKYYAYWGPFPALLRIFFNGLLKSNYGNWANLSCLIASFLSLCVYFKSLKLILGLNEELSNHFKEKAACIILLLFGLGSPFVFMTSMGQVYHESNLWGFCFGLFGIYYFLSYYFQNKTSSLFLLSLVSGLVLITRITFFIPIGFLFFLSIVKYFKEHMPYTKIKPLLKVFLIFVPLLIATMFQADYNYKRFGSYFTFADYKYYNLILNEESKRDLYFKHGLYNVKRFIPAFKSYFFFNRNCFHSQKPYIIQAGLRIENVKNMFIYQTLPFTISAPWLLLITVLGTFFLFERKGLILYKLGILGFLGEAGSILFLSEVHQRYVLDLMLGMVYLSFIFFTNKNIYKQKRWKWIFVLILFLGVFSIVTNITSTLEEVKFFWRS